MNNSRVRLKFKGSCLKQRDKENVVNLFIVYELDTWSRDLNTDFTEKGYLFGAVKLTKNADTDKYKYSGYSIGFYSQPAFSFPDSSIGKNVIVFGADMSSSVHIDNKGKDILTLGEGPTQGLDDTTLTAEAKYPISFTQSWKLENFVYVCIIIGATVFYLLMLHKYASLKQKILK